MKEPLKLEAEELDIEYTKKDRIIFIIIYASIFILVPAAVGIPLTAVLRNGTYVEALYMLFGASSLLAGLFRSSRRDTKNVRKEHTIVEDKDTPQYKQFAFQQYVIYIVGIICVALAVASFYICQAAGVWNIF